MIPLPPLPEQRRIVAKIEQLAAKVEEARTLKEHAVRQLDALIPSVVTRIDQNLRKLHPPLRLEDLAPRERGAFRSGPFGSALPHSDFVDEGVLAVGIQNVQENRFELVRRWNVTPARAQELQRYAVKPRDLLVTVMGTLGRACVVPDNAPPMISTKHVWAVTLDPRRAEPRWVSCWLNFSAVVREELLGQGTGTAIAGLNGLKIRSISLPSIPLSRQQQILAHLDALQALTDALKRLAAETAVEVDLMMPAMFDRAFKGEL
ncbi:MAG: hypothetical protein IMZ69_06235 [Spirochaetes bacterium]|nr:hypothetical protein [Spirochaetota bacterium]